MAVSSLEGQDLEISDSEIFLSKRFSIVIVTGAAWNPCGHMLLNLGEGNGHYLHVAKTSGSERPKHLNEVQYRTYLRAYHKEELLRYEVYLPYPDRAILKLKKLISENYSWLGLAHNCSSFVEEILRAGGWPYYMTSCPRLTELILEHVVEKTH